MLYTFGNALRIRHVGWLRILHLLTICCRLIICLTNRTVQISPGTAGKVEKWLSSPSKKADEKSLVSTNRVGLKRVNPDRDMDLYGNENELTSTGVASRQSPFRTPPSLSYCHDKVILS